LPEWWNRLLTELDQECAKELRRSDPLQPESIWPQLRVISCWGDAAAALPLENLRTRFPNVCIQPKGLLATEAFVTFPFRGKRPLAIESHVFEFIDDKGCVLPVEEVVEGEEYEIVVSTAGGLWRYRLGDRVCVTGFVEKTPSLVFVGRMGNVSDRFGEKLSESFVGQALAEVFGDYVPRFALVAPDEDEQGWRYTLYIEGRGQSQWAKSLDVALRQNPNYAYCRNLGQLLPPRIFIIDGESYESFAVHQAKVGVRFGDVKPASLARTTGWSNVFSGGYLGQARVVGIESACQKTFD
jgi:hypothetical protein